jgi:surface protein
MYAMFYEAISFNQDISNWCVENILTKPDYFDEGSNPSWSGHSELQPQWGSTEFCSMRLLYDTALSSGTTIYLPLFGTVDVNIDWGDENIEYVNTAGIVSHDYSTGITGEYIVSITGTLTQFGNNSIDNSKLKGIIFWGYTKMESLAYACANANNLTFVPDTLPNTVTNMSYMFANATSFNQNIGNWDVSNVVYMNGMFQIAASFNQNIGNWDVSNVTNMSYMFANATLFNQDIGNWDVSNVIYMIDMFSYATSFDQDIGNWDVSNVIHMDGMFLFSTSFNQNIRNWDLSNVTSMSYMFASAISFNQNIGNWGVSNVTSMSGMFDYAISFNQDIGNWNVSNVTDMYAMFRYATSFNQDISNWCVENILTKPDSFDDGGNPSWSGYSELQPQWGNQCA